MAWAKTEEMILSRWAPDAQARKGLTPDTFQQGSQKAFELDVSSTEVESECQSSLTLGQHLQVT